MGDLLTLPTTRAKVTRPAGADEGNVSAITRGIGVRKVTVGHADGPLFALVDRYTEARIASGSVKERTARNQRLTLLHFAETFGNRRPETLGEADVLRFLRAVSHQAPGTRRNKLNMVRGFCGWLLRKGVIKRDPCLDLRPPRRPKTYPLTFERDEIERLFAVAPDERARMMVMLGFGMGLRIGEMATLQLGDFGHSTARIRGKGDKERLVPISMQVRAALEDYIAVRGTWAGPLLVNYHRPGEGLDPHTISNLFRRWCYEAGIKQRPGDGRSAHGARRTFATEVADRTNDIQGVSELLGHESIQTTKDFYARHNAKKLGPLVESLPRYGQRRELDQVG